MSKDTPASFPILGNPEQARDGKEEETGRRVLALKQYERIQPDEGRARRDD